MAFQKSPFSLRERIEQKISPEPNSGCWLWTGCVGSHGYAQVAVEAGTTIVHRILYEEKYGIIPEHLECDHLCRVRCCVNPDHLELVTRRENVRRGEAPAGKKMNQTHCQNGHPLSGPNLLISKGRYGPNRRCRICRAQYVQDNHEKIKAQMRAYYYARKAEKQKVDA